MNETLHHYYDAGRALHPYIYSLPANPGSLPAANAVASAPPPVRPGVWPCWNGINWVETEDHRKREGQEAINYWLPGDTWETPARHMDEVGPLPDGASLTRPEKTADEERQEQIKNIKYELWIIDQESIRPLRASIDGSVTEDDIQKLKGSEEKAKILRGKLSEVL